MTISRTTALLMTLTLALLATGPAALADEGMWLFNHPPKELLKTKYGFEATDAWLLHLQRSSVRFNSGGSGSFVSSRGLVMTNHHVGVDALQKLGTKDKDYVRAGFHAQTLKEEVPCTDLELNVLQSIEDVTARVEAAVKPGGTSAEAHAARRGVMNTIEKESLDKTGFRSDVITLYQGGQYHLYRFKKYTDVRLVFAPEQGIAFFGGDPDNFEYPRYDLDICFFRVYENGQPARIEHYLAWSDVGVADGELAFVSGHPGHTDRLNTLAHLEFVRDVRLPDSLNLLRRREVLLRTYSERSEENKRRAQEELFGIENGRKALLGGLAGLQDPAAMNRKRAAEQALRQAVAQKPGVVTGDPWAEVAAAITLLKSIRNEVNLLENSTAFHSELFRLARTLVRLAEESQKPNEKRLREYRESNLESLKQALFSEAPIYKDLETLELADSLSLLAETLGADNEQVRQILAGKSPRARAAELVSGTHLEDVALRKRLAEGGLEAVHASTDPMIQLARLVDMPARRARETFEQKVDEPMRQAYARIAKAEFAVKGTNVYPDATFTLRLAFGVVRGYAELGRSLPPWTMLGGLYDRADEHKCQPPYDLPQRWLEAKSKLDLTTPMNFVLTADIIGGNSGSPVVNRKGQLVGIIFDGNLDSLVLDFVYTEEQARAIAVDSRGIVHALRRVYQATALADELGH